MNKTYIKNATEHLQPSRLIHMSNNGAGCGHGFVYPHNCPICSPNTASTNQFTLKPESKQNEVDSLHCGFRAVNGEHCVPDGLDHCAICKNFCPNTNLCEHGVCPPHSYSFKECSEGCR